MLEHQILGWTLPAICALFGLAFFETGRRYPDAAGVRWAAAGYFIASIGIILDVNRESVPIAIAAFALPCHLLTATCLLQACLVRHSKSFPEWPTVGFLSVAIIGHFYTYITAQYLVLRVVVALSIGIALCVYAYRLLDRANHRNMRHIILLLVAGVGATFIAHLLEFLLLDGEIARTAHIAIFYISTALLALAAGLAMLMVTVIDLVEMHHRESHEDHLTGLANRRALDDWRQQDAAGVIDIGAVMLVDLDYFKSVNDRFGHEAGDQVLVAVARALIDRAGPCARVARIGGEEFIVLVDEGDAHGAPALAQAIRMRIAALQFEAPYSSLRLTTSVGLALRQPEEVLRDTMRAADMALYEAKADGRDRVIVNRARRHEVTGEKMAA
jgi:diguanylate cyclase (GGDEF)-like protein